MENLARDFKRQYSTALIADAAYRSSVPVGVAPSAIAPLSSAWKIAGPVRTVLANNDLVTILAAVHRASAGEVMVITNPTHEVGLLGDLIGTEAKRKELGGFVVDGLVRDGTELLELRVPVFCRGRLPVGPLKLPSTLKGTGEMDHEMTIGEALIAPGDWAFGDADGVIFLPADKLQEVFAEAQESEQREKDLFEAMERGEALGDVLQIERFLKERTRNPIANFNEHLKLIGRAI